MHPFKSLFSFFIFLVLFCAGLTLRFERLIFQKGQNPNSYWLMYGVVLVAGLALGSSFHWLKVRAHKGVNYVIAGVALTFLAFAGVTAAEDEMSEARFLQRTKPEYFSILSDHCGVYAGRTVLKVIHLEFSQPQMGIIREFEVNNTCRLRHFAFLNEQNPGVCSPEQDKIECRIKWMTQFSEHGMWNYVTRRFFFAEILKYWPNSKKEEALVNYVTKDQELESGRTSLVRQAGIEEEFAEHFMLFHLKDELENLKMTQKVLSGVAPLLKDVKVSPPPYLLKFKDMTSDIEPKLAKIPEMEKEIAQHELKR